jgi:hypothetical protein
MHACMGWWEVVHGVSEISVDLQAVLARLTPFMTMYLNKLNAGPQSFASQSWSCAQQGAEGGML